MHTAPATGLVVLLIAVTLSALGWAGARRPSKLELNVVDDNLVLRISGRDALYALSRGMTIPLTSVQGIAMFPRRLVPATGLRLPGTGIPGLLRAGSYGVGASRDFWLVRCGEEVLVIVLQPGEPYRRLVLEMPNARAECLRLRTSTGPYTETLSS